MYLYSTRMYSFQRLQWSIKPKAPDSQGQKWSLFECGCAVFSKTIQILPLGRPERLPTPFPNEETRVKVPGNFKAMFCPDQPNPWRRNQRYGPLSHCMRPMKDNHSWLAIYQNRAPWVGQLSRTPPRNWLVRQIFGIWEGRGAGIQDIAGGEKGLIGEHVHTCGIMITTVVIMVMVKHYKGLYKKVGFEP